VTGAEPEVDVTAARLLRRRESAVPARPARAWRLAAAAFLWSAAALPAQPVLFNLPAQRADAALLAFSEQARVEVLFSYDELQKVRSTGVIGRYEPQDALHRLLHGTDFAARANGNRDRFIVTRRAPASGGLRGKLVGPDGTPAERVRVVVSDTRRAVITDAMGEFAIDALRPGTYRLFATSRNFQVLAIPPAQVEADRVVTLGVFTLQGVEDPARLDPFFVEGETSRARLFQRSDTPFAPRTATGNLDRPRTENDALPYLIYDREQIARSGVVNLNEFLQRELLDSNASIRPPEQDAAEVPSYVVGSRNLSLRGYSTEETVVLVNGRRLPELLTSDPAHQALPPDVNFIPLSLVQQVEVLPVSASALYSGNAVGGVINIVLRPGADSNATELTTTYTNALRGFDAPQSSVSLLHSRSLLGGALRLRLNASITRAEPATEAELGFITSRTRAPTWDGEAVFRATPNVRSAELLPDGGLTPLARLGGSTVASVAPGADGSGGLAAFAGRGGRWNLDLFRSPGGLTSSLNTTGYPYGRRQQRTAYFGSVTYDVRPWLQLGVDATHARTLVNRGYDVIASDFLLDAESPVNPFGQTVFVALNEIPVLLGERYSEARLAFSSAVAGALVTLPAEWRASLDAQYAHNLTRYRGLAGADTERWQRMIDDGRYNLFRDTQVHPAPAAFYDEVLVYRGGRNRFVTLGSYEVVDIAARLTNEAVPLPTGRGAVALGGDYRVNQLDRYVEERRYGDGAPAGSPTIWEGRTLERYSVFAEVNAPLLPAPRLPRWLSQAEANLAVRYVAADTALEANVAPTYGLKLAFAPGVTLRGSLTTASRYPTPHMSRPQLIVTDSPGAGVELRRIFDPVRSQRYDVQMHEAMNPELLPEGAVTQTAGMIVQRGRVHRFRTALDFVDTRKRNELVYLDAQMVMNLEPLAPERIERAAPLPGETAGRVKSVLTGTTNLSWRHSQNWNLSVDYAWTQCLGGSLEAYGRVLYFHRYQVQGFEHSAVVDELRHPEGTARGLLKYRARFGAGWSHRDVGFGMDGHYFHSRILHVDEWMVQGNDRIRPFWQGDAYVQANVGRWLPGMNPRHGLRVQLRVNNVFGSAFPKYVNHSSGAAVQPYGDWRGRVYSLSLTASF
jgi:iron complex outermembrane recepter protein